MIFILITLSHLKQNKRILKGEKAPDRPELKGKPFIQMFDNASPAEKLVIHQLWTGILI